VGVEAQPIYTMLVASCHQFRQDFSVFFQRPARLSAKGAYSFRDIGRALDQSSRKKLESFALQGICAGNRSRRVIQIGDYGRQKRTVNDTRQFQRFGSILGGGGAAAETSDWKERAPPAQRTFNRLSGSPPALVKHRRPPPSNRCRLDGFCLRRRCRSAAASWGGFGALSTYPRSAKGLSVAPAAGLWGCGQSRAFAHKKSPAWPGFRF
jgi:hypothetical protein